MLCCVCVRLLNEVFSKMKHRWPYWNLQGRLNVHLSLCAVFTVGFCSTWNPAITTTGSLSKPHHCPVKQTLQGQLRQAASTWSENESHGISHVADKSPTSCHRERQHKLNHRRFRSQCIREYTLHLSHYITYYITYIRGVRQPTASQMTHRHLVKRLTCNTWLAFCVARSQQR